MNGQIQPDAESMKLLKENTDTVDKIMGLLRGKTLKEVGIIVNEINRRIPEKAKL